MKRILASLGAGLCVASTATAHHGFGTFDLRSDIALTGTPQHGSSVSRGRSI